MNLIEADDLECCPFCGCDAEYAFVTSTWAERAHVVVKCSSVICDARARAVTVKDPLEIKSRCKEAAKAWNQRG